VFLENIGAYFLGQEVSSDQNMDNDIDFKYNADLSIQERPVSGSA
jgi:hypothetical protein